MILDCLSIRPVLPQFNRHSIGQVALRFCLPHFSFTCPRQAGRQCLNSMLSPAYEILLNAMSEDASAIIKVDIPTFEVGLGGRLAGHAAAHLPHHGVVETVHVLLNLQHAAHQPHHQRDARRRHRLKTRGLYCFNRYLIMFRGIAFKTRDLYCFKRFFFFILF